MYTKQPCGKHSKWFANCINSLCKATRKVLPTVEHQMFLNTFIERLDSHGASYTVDYFKAIYNATLHLVNGDKESAKLVLSGSNVAFYKKSGIPKCRGIGWIVRTCIKGGSNRVNTKRKMEQLYALLRCYTMLTEPKLSIRQFKKLLGSIAGPKPNVNIRKRRETEQMFLTQCTEFASEHIYCNNFVGSLNKTDYENHRGLYLHLLNRYVESKDLNMKQYSLCLRELYNLDGEYQLGEPDACSLGPYSSVYINWKGFSKEDISFFKRYINANPGVQIVLSCSTSSFYPKSIASSYAINEGWEVSLMNNEKLGVSSSIAGRIHVIQESGCKARVVAIPNANTQMAFQPLHKCLSGHLKHLSKTYFRSSFVYNQEEGAKLVHNLVSQGKPVYSIDLSAATDNFPRNLQVNYLRIIGLSKWADAIEEVAKANWVLPSEAIPLIPQLNGKHRRLIRVLPSGEHVISYSKGQPMGLYSSFPLFHTSHYHLAMGVYDKLQGNKEHKVETFSNGLPFVILGDDVVWSDKVCADAYLEHLHNLGVEVSTLKCFSGLVSEFAGHITVLAKCAQVYGSQYISFIPFKWKTNHDIGDIRLSSVFNYIDVFRMNPYKDKSTRQYKRIASYLDAIKFDKASTKLEFSTPRRNTVKVLSPSLLEEYSYNLCRLTGDRFVVSEDIDTSKYNFSYLPNNDKKFTLLTKCTTVPAKAHLETTIMGTRELTDPGKSDFVNKVRRIADLSVDSKLKVLSKILGSNFETVTSRLQQLFRDYQNGNDIDVDKLIPEGLILYNPRTINNANNHLKQWKEFLHAFEDRAFLPEEYGGRLIDFTDTAHFVVTMNEALVHLLISFVKDITRGDMCNKSDPGIPDLYRTLSKVVKEEYISKGEHTIKENFTPYRNAVSACLGTTYVNETLNFFEKAGICTVNINLLKVLEQPPLPKRQEVVKLLTDGNICSGEYTPQLFSELVTTLSNWKTEVFQLPTVEEQFLNLIQICRKCSKTSSQSTKKSTVSTNRKITGVSR